MKPMSRDPRIDLFRGLALLMIFVDHLEDLVDERTTMLVTQNAIADSLSQSLDLETILNMALDKVLPVLSMQVGLIFLLDRERKQL